MTTNTLRALAWLAVLLLAPAGPASAREGRLIGKVVDAEGKPIAGVRVTTTCAELPDFKQVATSNGRGLFQVDFEKVDVVYMYEFEKAGYLTLKVEQRWGIRGTERHEFKLAPAPKPALGDLPESTTPASTSAPAILAYNAGVAAFKAKDSATAAAKFQEATQHDPELRLAWVALSAIHLEQQRYREAAESAEKAVALGSTDASVLKARWEAYRALGDEAKEAEAREELEKRGRLGEEAKRLYNEGVGWTRVGDDKEALARFKEALELDPNLEPALIGVATSALKLGQPEEAATAAEALLREDPQHTEALKIRYNAALQLREETRLAQALLGLAPIEPDTARDGLFLLASAAFQKDETARAKEMFGQVLGIDPGHARAHYFMGLILMREGAKAEARSHLERFLQLAPDDPDTATARDALQYLK